MFIVRKASLNAARISLLKMCDPLEPCKKQLCRHRNGNSMAPGVSPVGASLLQGLARARQETIQYGFQIPPTLNCSSNTPSQARS